MVDETCSKRRCCRAEFPVALVLFQATMIVVYAFRVNYPAEAGPVPVVSSFTSTSPRTEFANYYTNFRDVHVMIFIGMGFIVAFLKKYSSGGIAMNLMIACVVIQWAILVRGFIANGNIAFPVGMRQLINADFTAMSVLISFGAVVGNLSAIQLFIMAMIHVPMNLVNDYIIIQLFNANDIGGCLRLHTFGAYFGLACSFAIFKRPMRQHENLTSSYINDAIAMVGTIFLWVFFPSFNSAMAQDDARYRAVINTYYALLSSTLVTFFMHLVARPREKFKMRYIQHATLSGGVAIACLADFFPLPYGALIIGFIAGLISVFGIAILQPAIDKIRIHDTCGVHNLHGMPGVVGGISCVVATYIAVRDQDLGTYGISFDVLFPLASTNLQTNPTVTPGIAAAFQLAALGVTIALALGSGLFAGAILRIPVWDTPETADYYDDDFCFETPVDDTKLVMNTVPPYEFGAKF